MRPRALGHTTLSSVRPSWRSRRPTRSQLTAPAVTALATTAGTVAAAPAAVTAVSAGPAAGAAPAARAAVGCCEYRNADGSDRNLCNPRWGRRARAAPGPGPGDVADHQGVARTGRRPTRRPLPRHRVWWRRRDRRTRPLRPRRFRGRRGPRRGEARDSPG